MDKETFKWLGKIFEAEVYGKLPFQSRAAIYKRLEVSGLCEFTEMELTNPNPKCPIDRIPMVVSGWVLTHKGRLEYCEACKTEKGEDPE